jgi:hypothetical protein
MLAVKRFLGTMVLGSLVGAILFGWFSPQLIVWYFSPPADFAMSCSPAVEWAISTYRKVMFTGVLIGALVGGILFFVFAGRQNPGGSEPKSPRDPHNP